MDDPRIAWSHSLLGWAGPFATKNIHSEVLAFDTQTLDLAAHRWDDDLDPVAVDATCDAITAVGSADGKTRLAKLRFDAFDASGDQSFDAVARDIPGAGTLAVVDLHGETLTGFAYDTHTVLRFDGKTGATRTAAVPDTAWLYGADADRAYLIQDFDAQTPVIDTVDFDARDGSGGSARVQSTPFADLKAAQNVFVRRSGGESIVAIAFGGGFFLVGGPPQPAALALATLGPDGTLQTAGVLRSDREAPGCGVDACAFEVGRTIRPIFTGGRSFALLADQLEEFQMGSTVAVVGQSVLLAPKK
jgi:hypothetical protein